MQEGKLYLVFDYLSMDLKKYIDSYGHGKQLEMTTIKSLTYQVSMLIASILMHWMLNQPTVMTTTTFDFDKSRN